MPVEDRQSLSKEIKQAVYDNWTIEGNAEIWAQAWERAMDRRQ
jgi:hypothetical protein